MIKNKLAKSIAVASLLFVATQIKATEKQWVTYEGTAGPGKGKHIVLIAGDEEYRSEEALPQLGKILSQHHGFKCTVLFSINPKSGIIEICLHVNINLRTSPGCMAIT